MPYEEPNYPSMVDASLGALSDPSDDIDSTSEFSEADTCTREYENLTSRLSKGGIAKIQAAH